VDLMDCRVHGLGVFASLLKIYIFDDLNSIFFLESESGCKKWGLVSKHQLHTNLHLEDGSRKPRLLSTLPSGV